MATLRQAYDHPNFVLVRTHTVNNQVGATGVQPSAKFRSRLKVIVDSIDVQVNSAATGSLILTLTHNGSVMAILTLGNTANENGPQTFTLTANKTLDAITDRLDVETPTHATGNFTIIYQYRVVDQDMNVFSLTGL